MSCGGSYIFLSILIPNLVFATPSAPAVIEIGSGVTTVYFANRDRMIEPILYRSEKISFAKDLTQNKKITEKTENLAREILNRFKNEAIDKGADSFIAVATEAFRQAPNAEEVRLRLEEATGLTIKVLSPSEEARLGFLTACRIVNIPNNQLTVFDMGSGSMQWATQDNERGIVAISKPIGTAITMRLFENIRPNCTAEDIYPVSPEELLQFLDIVEVYIRENFTDVVWRHDSSKHVAGVGFVQLVAIGMRDLDFGVLDEKANTITVTIDEVYQALTLITSHNESVRDESIHNLIKTSMLWKHPATLSVALMYTLMKHAGFEQITCSLNKDLVGNAVGILSDFEECVSSH